MEQKDRLDEYYSMFRDVFSNKNSMAISISVALWGMMGQGHSPFWALYCVHVVTNISIFSMINSSEPTISGPRWTDC